jgi:hypothetical protein
MTTARGEIEGRIEEHVRGVMADEAAGKGPPPGKGQTWGQPPDVVTRVGRYPDGSYYADAYWSVDEGYDDDYGSRSCYPGWCRLKGRPHEHCHRTAPTLEGLLTAATVPHSVRPPAATR